MKASCYHPVPGTEALPTPPGPPLTRTRLQAYPFLAAGLLLAVIVVVYAPTLGHSFVWDDHEQVVENGYLREWKSFPEFWKSDILFLSRAGQARSNYYRPLFYAQYLLYYQAFGLHAPAWHALALLHHFLACLAVWAFLRRLGFSPEVAFSSSLLFAVHPAHGESVSWIAAAFNDPPAATATLLALAAYAQWMRAGRRRHAALAALGFAVALCLKESAVSGLLLAPLVAGYVGREVPLSPREKRTRALLGYAPWVAVAALYFAIRTRVVLDPFGMSPGSPALRDLLPTFPTLILFYVRLLLWPWGLSPSYPLRYVTQWSGPAVVSLLVLAVLVLGVLLATRGRPVLRFASLWTAATVLPALNVFSFREYYLVHQRYLYLAVLGLCLAVAWTLAVVRAPGARRAILGGLMLLWSASVVYHDRFWATDAALWRRIAEVDPGNPAAFDWLGSRALEQGDVDGAEALFRRSLAADPGSPFGAGNLAMLLHLRRGRPAEALPYYERALAAFERVEPRHHDRYLTTRINYAVCLDQIGRHEEAVRTLLEVARTPPHPPAAFRNAAVLLRRAGRHGEVEAVLAEGVRRHPEDKVLMRMLAEARGAP
jgi:protein O-mannosyl-transferase